MPYGQKWREGGGGHRERILRQNLSQKVPSKKGSLGLIFSPRNYRENAHSKSANFEGRHSGGHLLGRPLLFPSEYIIPHVLRGYLPSKWIKTKQTPQVVRGGCKMCLGATPERCCCTSETASCNDAFWVCYVTGGILFQEHCFGGESSVCGKLSQFCEKLGEFALAHT